MRVFVPLVTVVAPICTEVATPPTAVTTPLVQVVVVPSHFITPKVADGDPDAFATVGRFAAGTVPLQVTLLAEIVKPVVAEPPASAPTDVSELVTTFAASVVPVNVPAAAAPVEEPQVMPVPLI